MVLADLICRAFAPGEQRQVQMRGRFSASVEKRPCFNKQLQPKNRQPECDSC